MRLRQVAALAFVNEMDKIASELGLPLNFVSAEDADMLIAQSFLGDMLVKDAATRAVKEWRKADAAGDTGTADSIAKGYGNENLKPRYLKDVSLGGAEAGVDKMMGDVRHSTGQMPQPDAVAPRRALAGRLDQMKENKAQLGVDGRVPSTSVKQSPEGRAALLRGAQPSASPGAAPNESGYAARKMYKPDSYISQAEFTPKLLEQKKQITDTARSISPEAKNMMPDMYGHTTSGTGPTQRSMSYHEFVPGMQDLRGKNSGTEDKPVWNQRAQGSQGLSQIQDSVLKPMEAKGMSMADVTGARGTNWGNVARGGDGHAKVVDFLPNVKGAPNPASQSFAKYAPMPTMRHSEEGGGSIADLRKEMYKPTMESRPAAPGQALIAMQAHQAAAGQTPPPAPAPAAAQKPYSAAPDPFGSSASTATPASGIARTAPAPSLAQRPTSIAPPASQGAAQPAIPGPARLPSMAPAGTAPATPSARAAPARPAPAASPMAMAPTAPQGIKPIGAAPVGTPMPARPVPMAAPHPTAMRPTLPTRPVLGGLHR